MKPFGSENFRAVWHSSCYNALYQPAKPTSRHITHNDRIAPTKWLQENMNGIILHQQSLELMLQATTQVDHPTQSLNPCNLDLPPSPPPLSSPPLFPYPKSYLYFILHRYSSSFYLTVSFCALECPWSSSEVSVRVFHA